MKEIFIVPAIIEASEPFVGVIILTNRKDLIDNGAEFIDGKIDLSMYFQENSDDFKEKISSSIIVNADKMAKEITDKKI